ncbi:hypothetical protein CQR46_1579 [Bifidobacterium pseudolongum subsp. globosum]|uniref:Uncharacterized protein n=1 Tax=Bifidobacterium pseudolongum subsp. globosum TaxID=1690 RepID=A0A2N3QEC3_9BIFI|nr:hypothetical protein CQR46_1579 [Bifidobacterium pseudolongum subsp. globosum]
MRGKLFDSVCRQWSMRIIPAHAGQTSGSHVGNEAVSDHPRACGANIPTRGASNNARGSSPRMRGKLVHRLGGDGGDRIIPAHAGQTFFASSALIAITDHPRACGANPHAPTGGRRRGGSSPRMRGKLASGYPDARKTRIIPAHAGQTCSHLPKDSKTTDHPRACGANCGMCQATACGNGSSPRMRGKLRHVPSDRLRQRIIPAHAGQTRSAAVWCGRRSDHPRACGANLRATWAAPYPRGSLPQLQDTASITGGTSLQQKVRALIPRMQGKRNLQ